MHSAVISACHRYPALQLAPQPGHERAVRPGPLVLGSTPRNPPTPTADTDRTVSRMFVHHLWWHGLYLHPSLATKETGVLAAGVTGDSLRNGSVSTGARYPCDFRCVSTLSEVTVRFFE